MSSAKLRPTSSRTGHPNAGPRGACPAPSGPVPAYVYRALLRRLTGRVRPRPARLPGLDRPRDRPCPDHGRGRATWRAGRETAEEGPLRRRDPGRPGADGRQAEPIRHFPSSPDSGLSRPSRRDPAGGGPGTKDRDPWVYNDNTYYHYRLQMPGGDNP